MVLADPIHLFMYFEGKMHMWHDYLGIVMMNAPINHLKYQFLSYLPYLIFVYEKQAPEQEQSAVHFRAALAHLHRPLHVVLQEQWISS